MKLRSKKYIALFGLFFILFSCNKKTAETTVNQPEAKPSSTEISISETQYQTAEIALGGLQQRNVSDQIKANGMIDVPPQNMATISAPMGGFVKFTTLLIGDFVQKGQVLATLQHQDYIQLQEDYLKAINQATFLEQELKRQQELSTENVGAKRNLQQTQSDYNVNLNLTKSLEAKLAMIGISPQKLRSGTFAKEIPIISPIAGYVTNVNINVGKYVNPTDVMIEIVNIDILHAELKVFEKDIFKIKKDQKVLFRVNTLPSKEFTAIVHLTGKSFDNDTKTINIHCDVMGKAPELMPGMYVNARILTGEKLTDVLPEEAVIKEGELNYVFLLKEKKDKTYSFEKVAVKTGILMDGFVEFISFYEPHTEPKIITKGTYFLQAAMKNTGEEE